jgi:hypothetical protein
MDTGTDMQTHVQIELYKSRQRLKREMQRALSCISPKAKRALAAEWQEKYSELFYKELIACARSKSVCREIADWNLETMK